MGNYGKVQLYDKSLKERLGLETRKVAQELRVAFYIIHCTRRSEDFISICVMREILNSS